MRGIMPEKKRFFTVRKMRLESKIFGVLNNLGQGLQEWSQISTIDYSMISGNIDLQICISSVMVNRSLELDLHFSNNK